MRWILLLNFRIVLRIYFNKLVNDRYVNIIRRILLLFLLLRNNLSLLNWLKLCEFLIFFLYDILYLYLFNLLLQLKLRHFKILTHVTSPAVHLIMGLIFIKVHVLNIKNFLLRGVFVIYVLICGFLELRHCWKIAYTFPKIFTLLMARKVFVNIITWYLFLL